MEARCRAPPRARPGNDRRTFLSTINPGTRPNDINLEDYCIKTGGGTFPKLQYSFGAKMTGVSFAEEAVMDGVLSTRSYTLKSYVGALIAESDQQLGSSKEFKKGQT